MGCKFPTKVFKKLLYINEFRAAQPLFIFLELTPKYLKFAFYCIFTLQFFKTCGDPGPHGPHGYEGPGHSIST